MSAEIPGVVLSRLDFHADERGGFAEIVRGARYPEPFVQSNHSRSLRGVLRGLHYHKLQADLWYVVSGRIQVGLADVRRRTERPATATLGLREDDPTTLYIPPGVAHGFLALTDVDLIYWVTREYDGTDEHGIAWDDPTLSIPWDHADPILSDRDRANVNLRWDLVPSFS